MWHGLFITLHAAAGVIAFAAGCAATVRRWWFAGFFWSLVAMVVLLGLAVAVDWSTPDSATQLLFVAFLGLGLFMVWRAWCARRILAAAPDRGLERSRRYVRHLGFNLVALFDAFVVITVLNGGVPGLATAVVGVGVAVAGHFVAGEMERRLGPRSAVVTREAVAVAKG